MYSELNLVRVPAGFFRGRFAAVLHVYRFMNGILFSDCPKQFGDAERRIDDRAYQVVDFWIQILLDLIFSFLLVSHGNWLDGFTVPKPE